MKKLVDKIVSQCEAQRFSQRELALSVGIDPTRISKWKNGTEFPTLPVAYRIAQKLSVPLDWLCDDAQQKPPGPALSETESAVVDLIRVLSLSKDEALLRIATPPAGVPAKLVGSAPIAVSFAQPKGNSGKPSGKKKSPTGRR